MMASSDVGRRRATSGGFSPLSVGTARDFWRLRPPRHSGLALPEISGFCAPLATQDWHCQWLMAFATQRWHCQGFLAFAAPRATQDWHCQGLLAFAAPSPLSVGTARDYWLVGAFFWHCQGLLASAPRPLRARNQTVV